MKTDTDSGLAPAEAEAIAAICLLAGLADGRKQAEEREQLKEVFRTLGDGAAGPAVLQRVLLKRTDAAREASALRSAESKQLAYELAVCVCDADGVSTAEERAFLDELSSALGLEGGRAAAVREQADGLAAGLADLGLDEPLPLETEPAAERAAGAAHGAGPAAAGGVGGVGGALATTPAVDLDAGRAGVAGSGAAPGGLEPAGDPRFAEADRIVLKYAILNGGLELLPQNLATVAILPLQIRMVYAVGKTFGVSLDRGHIKEFIATLGAGAASQMIENVARDLVGKFAKKALGKTAGKIAKKATGPMMTFASTYAMGQVAKAYYAGGRKLSRVDLRGLFQREVERGKALYTRHEGDVQRSAANTDAGSVMRMVRGK